MCVVENVYGTSQFGRCLSIGPCGQELGGPAGKRTLVVMIGQAILTNLRAKSCSYLKL